MKIVVIGTRGIPDIQGGVETHCQELYPRLVKLGCEVTLITRNRYIKEKPKPTEYKQVKLKHVYAPNSKSFEAIIHTFLAVIYAYYLKPDILHIHAIGPSIMVPFAKLLRLNVVVTNHGPDYDRQKWGRTAKLVLQLGEKFGTIYANKVIVISETIKSILKSKYPRDDFALIHNGVNIPTISKDTSYIASLGLEKNKYIIGVGRLVPEKGFHDLIEAYSNMNDNKFKLVIVGDSDHETSYSKELKQLMERKEIIHTGFIRNNKLNEIFSHAGLFVLPSYHEGLPIVLLEALSYNLNVLASNIPANLEVKLVNSCYFDVGNISSLGKKLHYITNNIHVYHDYQMLLRKSYNWDSIAKKTAEAYIDSITPTTVERP